jgi:catechol 2,3-dioxygenase-like lactoylglutathione lyase family enzyme
MAPKNFTLNPSHVELGVSDFAKSIRFYDLVLKPLGWMRIACTESHSVYCDGFMKLILTPVEGRFKEAGISRKRMGLNHLAFCAISKEKQFRSQLN